MIVIASEDGMLTFLEPTGEVLLRYDAGHVDLIVSLAFDASERSFLISGSLDGTVRLHNITLLDGGKVSFHWGTGL